MKVAVVFIEDQYTNYGDDYSVVARSITDWAEVTEEEYEILKNNMAWGQLLLKCPENQKTAIAELLEQAKEKDKKLKAQREAARLAHEKTIKKKQEKAKAKELKLLAQLKQKYEAK